MSISTLRPIGSASPPRTVVLENTLAAFLMIMRLGVIIVVGSIVLPGFASS